MSGIFDDIFGVKNEFKKIFTDFTQEIKDAANDTLVDMREAVVPVNDELDKTKQKLRGTADDIKTKAGTD